MKDWIIHFPQKVEKLLLFYLQYIYFLLIFFLFIIYIQVYIYIFLIYNCALSWFAVDWALGEKGDDMYFDAPIGNELHLNQNMMTIVVGLFAGRHSQLNLIKPHPQSPNGTD